VTQVTRTKNCQNCHDCQTWKKQNRLSEKDTEEHRGRSGDLVIGKGNIYHGGAAKAKAYRGFAQMTADPGQNLPRRRAEKTNSYHWWTWTTLIRKAEPALLQ